jgi:hypothetical protein
MSEPVCPEVRDDFLNIDPFVFVIQWLSTLQEQNYQYEKLVKQGVLTPMNMKELGLPIQLPSHIPQQMISQIYHFQTILKVNTTATPHHLLQRYSPIVDQYYSSLRNRYPHDPLAVMWAIYKGNDDTPSRDDLASNGSIRSKTRDL